MVLLFKADITLRISRSIRRKFCIGERIEGRVAFNTRGKIRSTLLSMLLLKIHSRFPVCIYHFNMDGRPRYGDVVSEGDATRCMAIATCQG